MIGFLLALLLADSPIVKDLPICEKPAGPITKPELAPDGCMYWNHAIHECGSACYWPGRPDGGSWDDVLYTTVRMPAGTPEAVERSACRQKLLETCLRKRGAPR